MSENRNSRAKVLPTISVIMSVYNCENYIKESIESILNQTFSDFEFIITDDCSNDSTLKILKRYAKKDNRIKLRINFENLGLTNSLNKMINISGGEFIARMDADDISLAQRFEKQISFMKKNPDIGFCGTKNEFFGNSVNKKRNNNYWPIKHEEIKATLLFSNVFIHSTVIVRKKIIDQYKIRYNENYRVIQDYELWQRLICLTKASIIPEVLLKTRIIDNSVTAISSKKEGYRENILEQIFRNSLRNIGVYPNESELSIHYFIGSNIVNSKIENLKKGEAWLNRLYQYNQIYKVYDKRIFNKLIYRYWFFLCTKSTSLGVSTATAFFQSTLYDFKNYTIKENVNILVKCLFRYKKR